MKTVVMAVGAVCLVLGFALILIAPLYMETQLYKQEAQSFQSTNGGAGNSSLLFSVMTNSSNQALEMTLAGAVIAAAGAAAMVLGFAAGREGREEAAPLPSQQNLPPTP